MRRESNRVSPDTSMDQPLDKRRSIGMDEDEQRTRTRRIDPALPQRNQNARNGVPEKLGFDKDLDDVRRAGPYERFENRGGPPGTRDNQERDRYVTIHSDNTIDRHGNRKRFAPQDEQERHEKFQQGSRLPSDTRPVFQGGGKKHSGRL